jgi:putative hydrolase of the HAD superfamily
VPRDLARALLIDFDGVLRLWDPAVAAAVEESNRLEPGVLLRTAMSWDIYRPAVSGEITDEQWMGLIASRLPLPLSAAEAAVAQWQSHRGYVDTEVLAFVREVRAAGVPVGLATNATDRLRGDLTALGLDDEFDVIASSWEMKVHKPSPEFFQRACVALRVVPRLVMFVDDDDRSIGGARVAGLSALRWSARRDFGYLRPALGLA